MMSRPPSKRGLVWAILGGLVLLIGIGALLLGSLFTDRLRTPDPATPEPTQTSDQVSPPPEPGTVVDASASERGFVPEPITTDAATYVRSALAAAGTFDTQKADYEEWITHLGAWFTHDTRYTSEADREAELAAAQLEMRQGVVLPEDEWDSLAREQGRVTAVAAGDVTLTPAPQDPSGDMSIGTADVVITYSRSDGGEGEITYDETARVSVQVLCGPGSIPTPNSGQSAGDCKVVRFFTEPVEP